MPNITLPDGSHRSFDNSITVLDVAKDIGPGLAKATIAGVLDGRAVDANHLINADAELKILTSKDSEGLDIIRHSSAHLLAQAVKQLYPETRVSIGPVIENGFYYDFAREKSFSIEELSTIEKRMNELAKAGLEINKKVVTRDEAINYFKSIGEDYKVKIIEELPEDQEYSLYSQGDFVDLCRGPHVPTTAYLKYFKIMSTAGAYWRGDSKNEMLQRIYATAWSDKKQLKDYIYRLEEAEKRDHRKLGKKLDLFHFQEDSPGIAFWHANGTAIWREVEDYMRRSNNRYGCTEIRTPLIADIALWDKSGHSSKYAENMFVTSSENRAYALRPMNCPTCVQVYNNQHHSYRDLPIRMAEFGIVHRNEASGSLHGLMRVRSFTQDDGHIFCTEKQVESEVIAMVEQCFEVYKDFGFKEFDVKLALRPEQRIGSDAIWDKSEKALASALQTRKIDFSYLEGEGAFYGPKIEFHLKDSIGRSWQCGTIQMDFSMPERLGASYIDEGSEKKTPVMLHRAIVGSLERFIGILIENHAGNMPVWLAPIQVVCIGITNKQDDFLQKIHKKLEKNGFRCKIDLRKEKIGFKIREHTLAKIPYQLIVGDKEEAEGKVAVRKRDGSDLGQLIIDDFIDLLKEQIENRI